MKSLLLCLLFPVLALAQTLPPTQSQVSGDTSNVTTFNYLFPNFAGTHSGTTVTLGTLGVAGGGTGSTSFTAGSIPFSNGTSLTQANANLFWDNTNLRLGIGTNTPTNQLQINYSVNGNNSVNLTNANTGTSNSAGYTITNDSGASGQYTLFGANFVATYLQNATRIAGSKALWIASDVNQQNGGTDNIVFSPGGYNNITAQATSSGLTAINYTDTGIATSAAGAPLSITSGQVLTYGVTNVPVSSTTAVAIGTTATSLLTTTPAAGTYQVTYSGNITAASAAGNLLSVSIYVGGTQSAKTVRQDSPYSTGLGGVFLPATIATNSIVTVNGSQAIAIYGVSSAGTVTITQQEMDIVRVQ